MPKFKIVTPMGASFSVAGVGYKLEMEGLAPLDAEIVEIPDGSEDDFVRGRARCRRLIRQRPPDHQAHDRWAGAL